MACLNKTVKRVFSIVMTILFLCTALSPSVLAEDLAASTAANDASQTEMPSLSEASPVTCNNTGVFDEQTMTVWGLCDHTTIEQYLTLFDDNETVQKVEILKNGEMQISGHFENDVVVRLYQTEDAYRDYTVVGMDTAAQSPDTPSVAQSTLAATQSTLATAQSIADNSRSATNPYGFTLPLDGMNLSSHITSPYGPRDGGMHDGIDIAWGDMYRRPIKAVLDGTASVLYDEGGYGNYVVINHGTVDGVQLKTLYAHMDYTDISNGVTVTQGQVIGYAGNTGNSRGDHLHFEVIINGEEVDPIPYLTGAGNAPPDGSPNGRLENVLGGSGTITVEGWAFDPSSPSSSVNIHVYIGGPAGSSGAEGHVIGTTNITRSDVNNDLGITGTHGFEKRIVTSKRGSQEVYVYAINIGEGSTTSLGHMTVTITGKPIGSFDSATGGFGTVTVKGWAFDYDDTSASVNIHVYIGGPVGSSNAVGYVIGATNMTRSDVNNKYNISGTHGFSKTITTAKRGTQEVYVYAINLDVGSNTLLGHKTVTIRASSPVGNYESATGGSGTVTVKGWAFDYDDTSASVNIHVYIGGPAGSSGAVGYVIGATNITRSDVNSSYGISGKHGFKHTIITTKRGTQEVYVYAINFDEGSNTLLGHKTVTIRASSPVGNYESATGGSGTVTVKGWAFDYDDTSASVNIHVYIGGPAGSSGAKGYVIGATNITRSDVNSSYGIDGKHGFNHTITTTKVGTQKVYVYAINFDEGSNTLLGYKTVTIT